MAVAKSAGTPTRQTMPPILVEKKQETQMKARVDFTHILQDSQEIGSDNEHMVSRVFFNLKAGFLTHEGLYVDVKQIAGGEFESTPLEIGPPHGYRGPFNHQAFRDLVEQYYRNAIGSSGWAIRVAPGAKNIRMQNNMIRTPMSAEIELPDGPGGW